MPASLRLLLLSGLLLLPTPRIAEAQAPGPARIRGVVYDSLRSRPLAGAMVTVMQVAPAPQQVFTAVTDSAGRYVVDSLVAGQFRVDFTTPFLDSLEIQLPSRELTLGAGEQGRVDFATPSRATLAAAACPGVPLGRGRGAIIGQVMNAETDAPLGRATIAASWTDIGVDLKAMKGTTQQLSAAITTDSLGRYRACGVPTDTYILLQVQHDGKAGTALRAMVAEQAGVMLQNLSLSEAAARTFSAADSTTAPTDTATRLLTGTASVRGLVRTLDGAPLADATVSVVDAAGSARTDATGSFALNNLPAGTQVLEARRVGYLLAQRPLELRAGRAADADIRLSRIVTLEAVNVVAQRTKMREFERRASNGAAAGTFLTEQQLERLHVSDIGDMFRYGRTLGFQLVGDGVTAKVRSTRGQGGFSGPCDVNVVIDRMQHQDINLVPPSSIAAMEIYRSSAGAPAEFDSACGVIVIWTKG